MLAQQEFDTMRKCRKDGALMLETRFDENVACTDSHPLAAVTYECGHWEFVRHEDLFIAAQCHCGHDYAEHGSKCRGAAPYDPQCLTDAPCPCKKFTYWPERG